jgi:hypothetical protein
MLCLADNTTHSDLVALHKHLRFKLKLKQAEYYLQYHPRACKATGQPIPFKDHIQYFETDFVSPEAMKSWFKTAPRTEVVEYALQMLWDRTEMKGLSFAMGDTELQSLGWPRARFFEALPRYRATCDELGLKRRFELECPRSLNISPKPLIIDTREQDYLAFGGVATVRTKLEYGDYALQADQTVAVERKSLADLIGTLIGGYDRFVREIQRCQEVGGYLVVLCETDIHSALHFDEISKIRAHTKVLPQVVFHNIRELSQTYGDSVQFAFCEDRLHMTKVISTVLNWGDAARRIDIQHLINEGVL